jgi:hypothetical protein
LVGVISPAATAASIAGRFALASGPP